ncbi:MAG TPA: DUF1549 domain-containing protein [Pirellulaceae bacterium]|nr:DUF1549 domain-containing protein [Pirellulaceae bacterium]HMO90587.1 DUF1549 domain-containing protein [Pirellulaceae bacterium]HMP67834.1 DUF1549 domain-containing protein [Pirellulaceae bacterium]
MASKIDEQILNAFLAELIGQEKMPNDFTEEILRKHSARIRSKHTSQSTSAGEMAGEPVNPEQFRITQPLDLGDLSEHVETNLDGDSNCRRESAARSKLAGCSDTSVPRQKAKSQRFKSSPTENVGRQLNPPKSDSTLDFAVENIAESYNSELATKAQKVLHWAIAVAASLLFLTSAVVVYNANRGDEAVIPLSADTGENRQTPRDGREIGNDPLGSNLENGEIAASDSIRSRGVEEPEVSPARDGTTGLEGRDLNVAGDRDVRSTESPQIAAENSPRPVFNVLRPGEIVLPPPYAEAQRNQIGMVVSPIQLAEVVNQYLQKHWEARELRPTRSINDDAWLLRVANRLLGTTPNAPQLQLLRAQVVAEGRAAVVETLMTSPEFREQYLDHWARNLAARLIGVRSDLQGPDDEDWSRLVGFLRDALRDNKSWDQVAYELISAVGSLNPNHPQFNPATSYAALLAKRLGPERTFWTSHVSQTFLSENKQCVQCHDQSDYQLVRQKEFFELHAYFAQTEFVKDQNENVFLVNLDYLPQGVESLEEAAIEFASETGQVDEAYPALFGHPAGSRSGLVKEFDRRTALAQSIADSDSWKRSLVNHVWAIMLSSPLVFNASVDSATRELEGVLAEHLSSSQNNVHDLVHAIALSRVFALGADESGARLNDNPLLGTEASFSHFYVYPPSYRRPAETLAIVDEAYSSKGSTDLVAMRGVLAQRLNVGNGGTAGKAGDVPRVLRLRESLPEKQAAWAQAGSNADMLQKIAESSLDDRAMFEHIFIAALKRQPSDDEIEKGVALLTKAGENKVQALQDIWWALFNSHEFTWPDGIR